MFPSLALRARPWAYYVLAVGLGTTVAIRLPVGTAGVMQTPLVATLLMLLVVTREGWTRAGWSSLVLVRLGLRWWAPALLIPVVVFGLGHGVLWLSDGHALGRTATAPAGGLPLIALLFVGTVASAALLTALPEEIGWRGYLLPRLRHLGDRRALVLSGLMHAVWHLPVILFTDLYHAQGNRLLVIGLFLLVGTSGGVFMGYLRLRSGSLWPAVIAHAAHNVAVFFFASFTVGGTTGLALVAGERGLVPVALYLTIAVVILTRLTDHHPPNDDHEPTAIPMRTPANRPAMMGER